jgi:hypothetical protein
VEFYKRNLGRYSRFSKEFVGFKLNVSEDEKESCITHGVWCMDVRLEEARHSVTVECG